MLKSIKSKILSAIKAHPRLVTFGIGLAINVAVGAVLGVVCLEQTYAEIDCKG